MLIKLVRNPRTPVATLFSTTFQNTENPMSGPGWVQGLTTGLDWQNMRSDGGSPGKCYCTGFSPTEYDDNIAIRNASMGISSTRHFAQGTLGITGGYSPGVTHEMALHVGSTITANNIHTYEILCALASTSIDLMRWDGPRGTFVNLGTSSTFSALSDNDVVRAEFIVSGGNPTITIFVNASQKLQVTDTNSNKKTSGQPGLGGFARSGATLASHYWKAFSADTI